MNQTYQVMDPLPSEQFESLKKSIAEHGVQVAVEYDDAGNILDGHHRVKAAKELGLDWPKVVRVGLTESQKIAHSRRLNYERRHLTRAQRRQVIKDHLKENPELSDRAIARDLGVTGQTVGGVRTGKIRQRQRAGILHQPQTLSETSIHIRTSLEADPYARTRDIALKLGLSEGIVKRARSRLEKEGKILKTTVQSRRDHAAKQRIIIIRDLAAQGYRAQQIASKTGNGISLIRKIAADEEIHLSDKHIASKRIDPNRIINETVSTLAGCALGIHQINNLEKLDADKVSGWVESLNTSLKSINELMKKLKEFNHGN